MRMAMKVVAGFASTPLVCSIDLKQKAAD